MKAPTHGAPALVNFYSYVYFPFIEINNLFLKGDVHDKYLIL